ncbi:MAG: hypothetical protein LUG65_07260 [Clostridiales bacterium]|nr:hypothetical protein [Clostridiales bacterium]
MGHLVASAVGMGRDSLPFPGAESGTGKKGKNDLVWRTFSVVEGYHLGFHVTELFIASYNEQISSCAYNYIYTTNQE